MAAGNWIPAALSNWIPAVASDSAGTYVAVTLGVVVGGCGVACGVQYVSDHRAGVSRRWHALVERTGAWALYALTELGIRLALLASVRLPRLHLPHWSGYREAADRLALLLSAEPMGPAPRELAAGTDRLLAAAHGRHRLVRVPAQRIGSGR